MTREKLAFNLKPGFLVFIARSYDEADKDGSGEVDIGEFTAILKKSSLGGGAVQA